jgi:WD40 repeat protein
MSNKISIFCAYSHTDAALRKRLAMHLAPLRREGLITGWQDRNISTGTGWGYGIANHLNIVQIVLLLISADFLASQYYYSIEMKSILERYKSGEVRIIPIILRPVDWQKTPFGNFRALPTEARPVTGRGWRNQDEAFADIALGIRKVVEELRSQSSNVLPPKHKAEEQGTQSGGIWVSPEDGELSGDSPNISTTSTRTTKSIPSHPPERGTLLRQYDVHASYVVAVAWEPDGTRIASAGGDGTVRVWEAETGKSLLTYRGHTHWLNKANFQATIYAIAWAPKGERIVSAGHGTNVHIWNAATGQTLTLYKGHSGLLSDVFAIAWSPDGKQVASACSSAGLDKTVHLWDAATGQSLSRYHVPSGLMPNFSVLSLAWSPDGTRIAATCGHNVIRVWNTQTEHLISTYHCGSEWVSHIAWSPDSRYLALAHSDHTAQIWDTFTDAKIITYHEHKDDVRYVAWSPDATSLATASNDRTVHIWEPLTGKRIYIYKGHSDWATSLAWSPDGTRIASASNDKTVHIWQAAGDK